MPRTIFSQHDSPLGRWTRALYFPDAPLAAHVEMFWYVSGRTDFARDRRLPNGRTHLLFNLGSPPVLFERDSHVTRAFPTCWIAGQQQSYIETGSQGDTTLLGAQFFSHGAYRLLRFAQSELGDRVIELEALLGDGVVNLRQRLLETTSPQACFAFAEGVCEYPPIQSRSAARTRLAHDLEPRRAGMRLLRSRAPDQRFPALCRTSTEQLVARSRAR